MNRTYINWFAGCLGLAMYISMLMMMMVGANFSSFWFPSSLFRELQRPLDSLAECGGSIHIGVPYLGVNHVGFCKTI